MSDNAELGFSVDTADLDKAVKALDSMEAAAGRAGAAGSKMAHDFVPGLEQTAQETLRAESAGQKYIKAMQLQYDILGKNGAEIAALRAKYSGFSDDVVRQAAEIGKKTDAWKREEQAARDAAKAEEQALRASAAAANDAKKGMEGFTLGTAGASRELIVLAHEAMTGNFSRMPGSMMVLMERAGGLHTLFSALLSPIGLISIAGVAAFSALSVAIYQGAQETKAFNNALALTNNAAGMTYTAFEQSSAKIADANHVSVGSVRELQTQLLATGQVGSAAMGLASDAALRYAKLTGGDASDAAKKFADALKDPTRGAASLDDQMHFLTASQYDHIAALQRDGDLQGAQLELMKQLDDQLKTRTIPNLGTLQAAWEGVASGIRSAWESMKDWGKTSSLGEQLAANEKKIAFLKAGGAIGTSSYGPSANSSKEDQIKTLEAENAKLSKQMNEETLKAEDSKQNADADAAGRRISRMSEQVRTNAEKRKEALAQLDADFNKAGLLHRKFNDDEAAMDAEHARLAADINEKYKDKKPARVHVDQGIKHEYQEIARAAAMAAEAKAKLNQLNEPGNDKAAKVTPAEAAIFKLQAELLTPQKYRQGQEGDSGIHRAIAEYEKVVPLQRQYMALEEQRKEQKKQQQKEEKQQEDVERWGRKTGAQWQNSDAADISKMAAEREMIGQSADAKKIYNAQLKIERDYQAAVNSEAAKYGDAKLTEQENMDSFLLKHSEVVVSLRKEADIRRQTLIPAMKEQAEAQRTWQYGAQESWAKYRDSASNDASAASSVFNAGVDGMQSGLMNFFETGKLGWQEFATFALKEIERIMIAKAIAGLVGAMFGGGETDYGNGSVGMSTEHVGDMTQSVIPQAKGGAWSSGVQFFAKGGVFDQPTGFLHSGGVGVLGEEKPEAVMPLARGPGGELGVQVYGKGQDSRSESAGSTIIQHFYITTDGKTTQSGDNTAGGGSGVVKLAEMMKSVALQVITQEMRPGGAIYNQKAA